MATLSLRVSILEKNVTKTMQFNPTTTVFDTCKIIREKISEANLGQPQDYGLFLADEDPKKGVWLESGRNLEYYLLRNGDLLEYRKKLRTLRVRMLDGSLKTLMVDDSQPVANLMVVICTKIGIMNHDEYSLVRENQEEEIENKPNFGTLTLRRKKEEKDRDAKMEQLKKKLKTDDEVDWIDQSKTLREQGLDESETVLLRRRFFFSDKNIDSRDPIQLNLLYVQARDAILDTTHPVTQEKACEFAGIQCQIQFGDYNEQKYRPGFLDLKEFLPQCFVKTKGIEKMIYSEHKKHTGLSEVDAKVLYTKTARDLKTYGVTFFLVKEKMKGKNKLVPRLLGVTKDSVLRLDEKTKTITKTWPLTTVRRWAASPNTFTLDFGDYSDQYYSVQTTEGEQISQLIAGYIDIILKMKKNKDHLGIEGDEGSTMMEDSVSPIKATIMQHQSTKSGKVNTASVAKPAIMRAGSDGAHPYGTGHMQSAQYTTMVGQANLAHAPPMNQQPKVTSVLTEPQRALLSTINTGQDAISDAQRELDSKAQLPELGTDSASMKWKQTTMDTNKQNVGSQLAAMNAATAQVVTLTGGPPDDVDHTAVGAAISTITTNIPEMTHGVKMIAALMEEESEGDKLLDAAKKLCSAFSDLLKAAEPETKEPRQNLLNAASRVGEASHQVLSTIGEEDVVDREVQDILLGLAKAVANTTAALVLQGKNVAAKCEDQATQAKVINAATQCALATSQLVACAKVVAPTISSPACQQQLIEATKEVARAVEGIVGVCQLTCQDEHLMKDLGQAATEVTRALNDLLNHIRTGYRERAMKSIHEGSVDTILVATERLFASTGDAAEMVRQARILAQATAQLIQAIKGEAEVETNQDLQWRLLAAAKTLADATARMVEAAKACASNPNDTEQQIVLRKAAEDLRNATNVAASNALKKKLIKRLENAAKHAAATATQSIAASQGVGPHNSNQVSQEELMVDCKQVADQIPKLVDGVKGTLSSPDSASAQLALIAACQNFLQPGNKMVVSAKSVLPTVSDQSTAMQLSNSSKQMAQALADLQSAMGKAQEVCGSLEVESAIDIIDSLKDELEAFRKAAEAFSLKPLPGETAESTSLQLSATSKKVGSSMAQLLTAASQGNEKYTGQAARDTANSLCDLTTAVRGIAATTSDREIQNRIINSAQDVMVHSAKLIMEANAALNDPNNPNNQQRLANVAKGVSQALNQCVSCLPGQKDVEDAIQSIMDASQILTSGEFPVSNKSYGELQTELNTVAADLNDASAEVVATAKHPAQLAPSSKRYGVAFGSLIGVGMEMAGQTKDVEVRSQMVVSMKNVSMVSSKLLVAAKTVAADPVAPNAKNQLASAARAVTDSINYLINVCTSAAPGQKECDNAIRNIQSMKPLLQNPLEPVNDLSYFECLDNVMDKSKKLGDGMTGIANHAKKSEHEEFGEAVKGVSSAICGLIEAAAQAAYLVGVSDPSSIAGKPGLVDQSQFARASQAIQMACQNLTNPTSNQQQVLSAATVIAKHTSALCNSCRVASSKTANPVAKRQFVQSAKDVANATASLVKEIKALDQDYSDENRMNCATATKPLTEAVENLCAFASSPEFASIPAKISLKARSSQEPITESGKSIIDGSCAMIQAAKSLAVNPKDPPTWQSLANHSKNVSDSIKKLVASIRDKAPGQKECEDAIERLGANIQELDQASLAAISQSLAPRREKTLQGFNEQMENSANEIGRKIDDLRNAAKGEAEKLGHVVTQMVSYFNPLVQSALGSSSNMVSNKQQMMLLDQTKTMTECALQLAYAAKEGAGNAKATHVHADIDESADAMKDALHDLLYTVEHVATEAGIVTGLVDTITKSMLYVDERHIIHQGEDQYVDYQTRMVNAAKEIAHVSQEMAAKCTTDVSQLGTLAASMSHSFSELASDSQGAIAAISNAEIANRIKSSVQDLGQACIEQVKAGGAVQVSPQDTYAQRDLSESAKNVNDKVGFVLSALKAGSQGTQACINAASTVSGIIGDLDTTIMFATAGTLYGENDEEAFGDHRENILKTAKALVEDTKTLVAGAASSQEQLAVAAQNAVATIVQLSEVIKLGAASLGASNPEAQVMLINAVKDVASALGDLIQATKSASGKSIQDPAMVELKDSAKVMVTNVTSLLKTVKAVEDEHTRGTRALESTIEAIAQEIRAFDSPDVPKKKTTAEALVRSTKPITLATAKAVAAGNSCKQDDVIVAANMGRKSISDMLTTCKAAAFAAESEENRFRALQAGHDTAVQYRELLQMVMHVLQRPTNEAKQTLATVPRKIAHCVTELVSSAEALKGVDWVDPDDPTVIAENELLGAAASIDAAAKKLASLKPRRSFSKKSEKQHYKPDDDGMWPADLLSAAKEVASATRSLMESAENLGEEKSVKAAANNQDDVDETLNFDEMILEAAKSIAAATSALVKAASSAQRDLIEAGMLSRHPHSNSDDGQWSEGLVSAARLVAAATHSLCESANALVQGHSTEEKLISSAKQVASSTAQLLVACKVKADPNSQSMKRLQAAGNAVKRATDNLVRAAQQAIAQEEEHSLVVNKRMVGGIAQEIDARSEVLRIEKQLNDARGRLAAIRRAKYRTGEESDGDGHVSGYDSSTRYDSLNSTGNQNLDVSGLDQSGSQSHSFTKHSSDSSSVFQDGRRNFVDSQQTVESTSSQRKLSSSKFQSSYTQNFDKTATIEGMLQQSTQRMERTITMKSSNKSYHIENSST